MGFSLSRKGLLTERPMVRVHRSWQRRLEARSMSRILTWEGKPSAGTRREESLKMIPRLQQICRPQGTWGTEASIPRTFATNSRFNKLVRWPSP